MRLALQFPLENGVGWESFSAEELPNLCQMGVASVLML